MKIFFLLFSLERSFSLIPSLSYHELSSQHNKEIVEILEDQKILSLFSSFREFSTNQISSIITNEITSNGLEIKESFQRLLQNIRYKLQHNLTFNVLYLGGSVCVGHGCLPFSPDGHLIDDPSSYSPSSSISPLKYVNATFHCSWTHRFSRYLDTILHHLKHENVEIVDEGGGSNSKKNKRDKNQFNQLHTPSIISPRYCCKSATSSNTGVDILLTKSYKSKYCHLNSHYTQTNQSQLHLNNNNNNNNNNDDFNWEPDLILWDYSVNDLSSRVS